MENMYVGKMRVQKDGGRIVYLYERAAKKGFVEIRLLFTRNYRRLQGKRYCASGRTLLGH